MSKSHLERLEEFICTNPQDAFSRYGLAMEYARQGCADEALAAFEQLLQIRPNYTAAYYQAGSLLARLKRVEEARTMFQRGIEVATQVGDWHTKSKLEIALHTLPT